jgi:uncharacterized protein
MHAAVSAKRDILAELCRRFRIRRLEVFGSAARGADFDAGNADFLVEFEPDVKMEISTFLDVQEALEQALGRPVDLVDRQAMERSGNYLRRRRILQEAEPIYVAG